MTLRDWIIFGQSGINKGEFPWIQHS